MSEENVAVLVLEQGASAASESVLAPRPLRNFSMITLGICCYAALASVYYLFPNKRLLSLGQLKFTLDTVLESIFTFLSLPVFYLVHRHGLTNFDANEGFEFPDLPIELLVLGSIIWIALGNGIHLTSKLVEQILANSGGHSGPLVNPDIHYLRQVVGHVGPHIGWQLLFVGLMLGQFKRPHQGRRSWFRGDILLWGTIFGLLFAQGSIAASCTALGFTLTALSLAVFGYLAYTSKIPSNKIPIQRFFMAGQIAFLAVMIVYWSAHYVHVQAANFATGSGGVRDILSKIVG